MQPVDVVLFEGILVLYYPALRDLLHMKLFVDTDSDTRLARRGETLLYPPPYQGGVTLAPPVGLFATGSKDLKMVPD